MKIMKRITKKYYKQSILLCFFISVQCLFFVFIPPLLGGLDESAAIGFFMFWLLITVSSLYAGMAIIQFIEYLAKQ